MILNWVVDVPGIDFPSFDKTEEWRAVGPWRSKKEGKYWLSKRWDYRTVQLRGKLAAHRELYATFWLIQNNMHRKRNGDLAEEYLLETKGGCYIWHRIRLQVHPSFSVRWTWKSVSDVFNNCYTMLHICGIEGWERFPRWPITISKTEFTGSEIIWVGLRNGRPSYSVMRKNSISTVLMVWCTAGMTYGRRSQSTPVDPTVVDPWWFRGPFMPVGNPNWQFSKGSRMRCHTYRHLVAFYYPYYRRIARLLWFFSRITRLYTQPTSRKCGYCWKTSR